MAGKDMLTAFLRLLIWLYRHSLSYFLGSRCRFMPTCSAYADEALKRHGPVKGSWLALRRLCRCHPWGGEGYDPVPEERKQVSKNT
jgi:uncharacterized protein